MNFFPPHQNPNPNYYPVVDDGGSPPPEPPHSFPPEFNFSDFLCPEEEAGDRGDSYYMDNNSNNNYSSAPDPQSFGATAGGEYNCPVVQVGSGGGGGGSWNSVGNDDGDQQESRNNDNNGKQNNRVAFRTKSELEVMDDGFKWRKYGKKSVKNTSNPRHYYKCSSVGCNVKKRVERDSEDSSFVITTYDGVHTHESPSHSIHHAYYTQPKPYPSSSSSPSST